MRNSAISNSDKYIKTMFKVLYTFSSLSLDAYITVSGNPWSEPYIFISDSESSLFLLGV